MKRNAARLVPAIALLAIGVATFVPRIQGQNTGQPSTKNGDWPMYTADLSGSKYSPLDQINASQLQQARSRVALQDRQPRRASREQARGHADRRSTATVYATAGTRQAVVAIDATHRRNEVDVQRSMKASAPAAGRRASSPVAASPTGPTAAVTSASSTSPPATSWSSSMRRPAADSRRSARTASST